MPSDLDAAPQEPLLCWGGPTAACTSDRTWRPGKDNRKVLARQGRYMPFRHKDLHTRQLWHLHGSNLSDVAHTEAGRKHLAWPCYGSYLHHLQHSTAETHHSTRHAQQTNIPVRILL